jgi:hypothetical protein
LTIPVAAKHPWQRSENRRDFGCQTPSIVGNQSFTSSFAEHLQSIAGALSASESCRTLGPSRSEFAIARYELKADKTTKEKGKFNEESKFAYLFTGFGDWRQRLHP